ncbi:tumor necrosis factor receptor superfamily member 5 isoform 2-T2 [Spinachia spinachia]
MLLLLLLPIMGFIDYSAMTAAQHVCDPLTQYEGDGECCKKCGPGTKMVSGGSCLDPQCNECDDGDFQDTYTSKNKCQRQPYCDPNKNFNRVVHKNKKMRMACICKEGFHCSSGECITCVPHTSCQPGHGVQSTGNHTHDTVCQKCTQGTFSEDDSWKGACQEWQTCTDGFSVDESGSDVSDIICAESRSHAVVIVVCLLIVSLIGVTAVFWLCLCNGEPGGEKGKGCFDSSLGGKEEQVRETRVLITNPTDPDESLAPELLSTREEAGVRTPEENEVQLSIGSPDVVLSDNGNFVTQENGKSAIFSRQESQSVTTSATCEM